MRRRRDDEEHCPLYTIVARSRKTHKSLKDRLQDTPRFNCTKITDAYWAACPVSSGDDEFLAEKIGYTVPSNLIEGYIYRDCTGQLTPADMLHLREIERGMASIDASLAFQTYLKNLRLFVQYVTMRYRCFLAEFDPQERYNLHELIIEAILSGRLRKLCQCLDTICGEKRSFSRLFKMSHYAETEQVESI